MCCLDATTTPRHVRKRDVLKSPVLENCTPGPVRGTPGNGRPYLDHLNKATTRPVPRLSENCRWKASLFHGSNWMALKLSVRAKGNSTVTVDPGSS